MRLRSLLLALPFLTALSPLSVAAETAATVVSGTLLGHDGKPLVKAHVHLSRPQRGKPLLSVPVNADGRFRLATNETGLFILKFTGAHHQSDQTALFVDGPSSLELDVRLGTYAYKDDFSQVAVIGDFNGFKSTKAKPMEKQADGTWALTLEAPNGRLAYQLVGITKDSIAVNGARSDDFEYDGDDDYRSIVTGVGGKARIVFRPADLVRSSRPPELRFRDPGSPAARFAAVSAEMEARDRAYRIGVHAHMASGQPYQSFHMDWSRDVASMSKRLDAEKDPLVRQLLALSILSIPSCFGDLEPALALHAVESLSSSSALWALNPRAFWKLTPILHRGEGASGWSDYVSRVIDGQKDPEVVPVLLYWAVVGYREAEDEAAIRRLYDRLQSDYPKSRWTRLAKASVPAERTSIGKTVPEFALKSLDDASITFTPASLKGKITLIDLWATWCGPCVGERGGLHQAWERYHARGLEILSVSFDGDAETVARFRREKWKSPWMNALAEGGMTGEFAKSFEVTALPKLLLIDRDGKVIATPQQLEGPALGETLSRLFEEKTLVSGTLLGHDGKPLLKGEAHLVRPQHEKPLVSVTADKDGRFRLATNETGLLLVHFTGANHERSQVAFVAEKPLTLELDVRLAGYQYLDDFSHVGVVGDFNAFNFRAAKPMEKQPDGTWALTLEAAKGRLSYQLVGIAKKGGSVNGTQSDGFEYDEGGDYKSIVTAKDGKVHLVFRPADLVRSSRPAETRFRDSQSQAARFAAVFAEMDRRQTEYGMAVTSHMNAGKPYETFRMDWSGDVTSMVAKLNAEKDQLVRRMLALSILSIPFYGGDLEPAVARRALADLPPASPLWALNPWALQKVVPFTRGEGSEAVKDYAFRVTEAEKDPAVTPILLVAAFMGARDAGDQPGAKRLYDRLLAEFPQSRWTRFAKAAAPAGKTAVGRKIPDFALRSLDDPSVTLSPDSLKGKVTLIDFWATWCAPCVGELGNLHEVWERYHPKGLEILSISFDGSPDDVARFRSGKWKLPWLNAFAEGGMKGEFAKNLKVFAIPKQVLIDREGNVIATDDLRGSALQKTLDRILEGAKEGK